MDVNGIGHGVAVTGVRHDVPCRPPMITKLMQFTSCLRVTISIATIVGSRSGCSCCCDVLVALGRKDVMGVMILIEDVLTLLMMLKDCCRSAFGCCVFCVSRFPLTLTCRITIWMLLLWCSGCTWRRGRHGDKDVDRRLLRSETNKQTKTR